MDFAPLIHKKTDRFRELEAEIADGSVFANPQHARVVMQEHSQLKTLLTAWEAFGKTQTELADSQELAKSDDAEMAGMAAAEIPELEKRLADLERQIQISLLPPEPGEDRDAIVEIRAGTGGAEAALFAADLFRMYSRYAEATGLKIEMLESSTSELGGFREVIFRASGNAVFRKLRYESGVHRVQRVPATESQGRIHTSAAGVLVLPETEDVEVEIDANDLRIDVYRSSGPGGQIVNTTDSAVRITHIPTGVVVSCQNEKSQLQNKESAMRILRARLVALAEEAAAKEASDVRRSQVRTVVRSERIRTYNFPENRISDHRVGFKAYNLDYVLDGELEPMIQACVDADLAARMAALGDAS